MAVFGRRQPHAPLILRGLASPQPSAARLLVVATATRAAADAYFRRTFPPKVLSALLPARPPTGGQVQAGQRTSQRAADRFFRRSFPPVFRRAGPPPAVGGQLLRLAPPAYRPARRGVFVSTPSPSPVVLPPPVGRLLLAGAKASQVAADRYFRRGFPPLLPRAGGRAASVGPTVPGDSWVEGMRGNRWQEPARGRGYQEPGRGRGWQEPARGNVWPEPKR